MSHVDEIKDQLFDGVIDGEDEEVIKLTQQGLELGIPAAEILYEALIPALEEVGALFETGEYFKGRDLKKLQKAELQDEFGKMGAYFFEVVRGKDDRPVQPHRERKSIGAERTYESDIYIVEEVKEKLSEVIDIMWKRCESKNKYGRTISLKLRFADFETITRSHSHTKPFTREEAETHIFGLLPVEDIMEKGVRLLGATMSQFHSKPERLSSQLRISFDPDDPDTMVH